MLRLTGVEVIVDYESLRVEILPKTTGECETRSKGKIMFLFNTEDCTFIGVSKMILKSLKSRTAAIVPVDAAGNVAPVENIVWASSDEAIVSVVPSEDGLSAVFTAVGPVGNAQLTVTADADMGEGVTNITGTLDVQVIAGDAVAFQINVLPEEPVV